MNNRIKTILYSLGIAMFALIIWLMTDIKTEIISSAKDIKQKVIINDIKFYGFRDKKLAFKVNAMEGWSGDDINEAYLTDIIDGEVYNDAGNVVLKKLRAKKIYSNARYDNVIAKEGFSAFFLPKAYAEEKSTKNTLVEAENLRYDSKKKRTYIDGNVKITQDETTIYSDKAEIENEKNIAHIEGNITLTNEDLIVNADRMISYLDEENSVISGNVVMTWLAATENITENRKAEIRSRDTVITCETVSYSSKDNIETANLSGNIVIKQSGKLIKGDYAFYDGQNEKFYLFNNIYIELQSIDWLLRKKTKEQLKDKESKEAISQSTIITGNELVFDKQTNDVEVSGNVSVDQPKNEAKAGLIIYKDKDEIIELYNNVTIRKKDKDWIKASKAKMFLGHEMFEAMGKVLTEFRIKKKDEE